MNSWSITRIMTVMFYTGFTLGDFVLNFKLYFKRIIINKAANVLVVNTYRLQGELMNPSTV